MGLGGVGMRIDSDELVVDAIVDEGAENEDFLVFLPISGLKFMGKATPFPYPTRTTSLSFAID
jgi:hypothetical protein